MPYPLHVKERHGWDYKREEFVDIPEMNIELEHCLLAISKWEARWNKPFFVETHGLDEWLDYIGCMALDPNVDPRFAASLSTTDIQKITEYIQKSQTATWFSNENTPPKTSEQMTSELMYYYMAQVPLPFEICERWHLSRLISILKIASIKSQPDKKMSHAQIAAQNRALNAARHAKVKGMHK